MATTTSSQHQAPTSLSGDDLSHLQTFDAMQEDYELYPEYQTPFEVQTGDLPLATHNSLSGQSLPNSHHSTATPSSYSYYSDSNPLAGQATYGSAIDPNDIYTATSPLSAHSDYATVALSAISNQHSPASHFGDVSSHMASNLNSPFVGSSGLTTSAQSGFSPFSTASMSHNLDFPPASANSHLENHYLGAQFPSHEPSHTGSSRSPRMVTSLSLTPSLDTSVHHIQTLDPSYTPVTRPLPSPTVRVENWTPDASVHSVHSQKDDGAHSSSQNSLPNNHLSPFTSQLDPFNFASVKDQMESHDATVSPVAISTQRMDNGAWVNDDVTGTSGISPDDRAKLASVEIPTLDEQEKNRMINEKKGEVHEWLKHTKHDSRAHPDEGHQDPHYLSRPEGRPRARSTNDMGFGPGQAYLTTSVPGPGVLINEPSELDEDESSDAHSDQMSQLSDLEALPAGLSAFTLNDQTAKSQATESGPEWTNPFSATEQPASGRYIQSTANDVIVRFERRYKDYDTASITVTIGSRRRSESDMGSLFGAQGVSASVGNTTGPAVPPKKGSLFGSLRAGLIPNRSPANKLKRKPSNASQQPTQENDTLSPIHSTETQPAQEAQRRKSSTSKPRTPKIVTNVHGGAVGQRSPIFGPFQQARNIIKRTRSKSDLSKPPANPGLAEMWRNQLGGPPVAGLASPLTQGLQQPDEASVAAAESSHHAIQTSAGIQMDLSVRTDIAILPTYQGFMYHATQLNPRMEAFLRERMTKEQFKRYQRLLEAKKQHERSIAQGTCKNQAFCTGEGGKPATLSAPQSNKDKGAAPVEYQIMKPNMTEEDIEQSPDAQVVPATFPSGIPLPPVERLPAEFECPLCFEIKKIYKPSDWTKHVHEDVQPFTCTFNGCNEPKSFSRKADWVRHESERHRQLEKWVCEVGDCTHECYRKNNFYQHLIREHKITDSGARSGRNSYSKSPFKDAESNWQEIPPETSNVALDSEDDVWAIVRRCHQETDKNNMTEQCRFCGNILGNHKKLTAHLAKHMEQISLPVLGLINPMIPHPQAQSLLHPQPLQSLPMQITDPSTAGMFVDEPIEMDFDGQSLMNNGVATQSTHSYPPLNMGDPFAGNSQSSSFLAAPASLSGQSYPPPSIPARPRSTSFNTNQHGPQFAGQGTSYPPANMVQRPTSAQFFYQQPSPQQMNASPQQIHPGQNRFLTPDFQPMNNTGYF